MVIWQYDPDFIGPRFVEKAFGPEYPNLASNDVKLFRAQGRLGLDNLSPMGRRGYGNAVLSAIRSLQAQGLKRAAPPEGKPNCASGTFHQTGADILKAVATSNRSKCLRQGPFDQREADRKYAAAMAAKRAAQFVPFAIAA
jgi:hypothetical protein